MNKSFLLPSRLLLLVLIFASFLGTSGTISASKLDHICKSAACNAICRCKLKISGIWRWPAQPLTSTIWKR